MKPVLQVIIASTRPTRVGGKVARFVVEEAQKHGGFEVETVDLREINLPQLDEPNHPRMQKYEHEHTKAWSKTIDRADAFIFVIPEYNFFAPPALVNAVDYLSREWQYKPAGVASYGGVSAGLRSAQAVRQLITAMKIMPVPEAVSIPFVAKLINDAGELEANEPMRAGAQGMLNEVARWEEALRGLRRES